MPTTLTYSEINEGRTAIDSIALSVHNGLFRAKGINGRHTAYLSLSMVVARDSNTIGSYAATLGVDIAPFCRWLAIVRQIVSNDRPLTDVHEPLFASAEAAWPDAYAVLQILRQKLTLAEQEPSAAKSQPEPAVGLSARDALAGFIKAIANEINSHQGQRLPLLAVDKGERLARAGGFDYPPLEVERQNHPREQVTVWWFIHPHTEKKTNALTHVYQSQTDPAESMPGAMAEGLHKAPPDVVNAWRDEWLETLGVTLPATEPIQPQQNVTTPAVETLAMQTPADGYLSPTDIAKVIGAVEKADAIRMALQRAFKDNLIPDNAWIENHDAAKGQAKILYRLSGVLTIVNKYRQNK